MIKFEVTGAENVDRVRKHLATGYPTIFQSLQRALSESAFDLVGHIKRDYLSGQVLRRQSGRLSRSIHADPIEIKDGEMSVKVGTNVEYAGAHEFGVTTKPHIIRPKRGQSLRWVDSGGFSFSGRTGKVTSGFVFRREVHHPGSKIPARPFLRPALEDKRASIVARIQAAVKDASVNLEGPGRG